MTLQEIQGRIQEYLQVGGLFNPEMMEHDKVRKLLMDILDYVEDELQSEV